MLQLHLAAIYLLNTWVHYFRIYLNLEQNNICKIALNHFLKNAFTGGYFVFINFYIWHHKSPQTLTIYRELA